MHIRQITPVSLAATAVLAASLASAEEEVTTETIPLSPAQTGAPTDLPDPVADLPAATAPAPAAPSNNVTINLINSLVQKGILTQAEAAAMIQQAEADAMAAARADIAALPPEPSPEDEMRITYIPDVVRNQMRDQIKQELMAAAREEKWSEKEYPEWTSRFVPFGDIRVRSENIWFPSGNAANGAFPDFNRINTGAPYDTSLSNPNFAPQRNVDEDRHRFRLRARAGAEILLGEGFNAGVRVATGNNNSPTSTNQTLSGNFSKYAVWLDQAFISYDAGPGDGEELTFFAGRYSNPFFSTVMHWDDDLNFDGLAVRGRVRINDSVHTFFTGGYFPIYNTDFNFATNQPEKFESNDRWLTGLQVGIDWKINEDLSAKFAVAYYDFDDMQGRLSSPFIPLSVNDAGDTDSYRPAFAQNGNTYIPLRNIDNSTAANDFGNRYQFQYFGLASEFRNITLTGRLDYDGYDPVRLSLIAEATKNTAFNASSIASLNNRDSNGNYDGGDTAMFLNFIVGKPALESFGDWQASIGYRYIESDAVVDGFNDSDFGGGGTNVKGFTLGGLFALSRNVRCGLRWLSSDEVAGPPLSTDTLQIDLNARF